jgi:glucose uptake protein GlcU
MFTIYSDRGLDYVISFAIGAAIATVLGWVLFFCINSYNRQSFVKGYKSLPSLYLDKIILPGALSGVLWSIGNVSQILAVTFLGESIGMSICQSQMIISGLLGIVLFEEIKGRRNISSWVLSALVTFIGIVLLSKEHKS